MKSWKKILGLAVMALSTTMFLTACGSKKEASDSDGKVTIRMSWWGNDDRHKATLDMIKKFEKSHPNITVKAEYSGWDGIVEKMATQIAGGTEPDLMQMNYDWYMTYSPDGNGFYDLNELSDVIDFSGFSEDLVEPGTINGKLNGITFNQNMGGVCYNKTTFDKFGVEIPETWDDLIEAAKKFPDGYYPLAGLSFYQIAQYLAQKYDEPVFDEKGNLNLTEKQIQEGLEWKQSMVDAGVIPSQKEIIENIGNNSVATVKQFIEGNYAGQTEWIQGVSSYKQVLDENNQESVIAKYPTIDGAKSDGVVTQPSMEFSISKNTKHPKETAELLNFMLNEKEGVLAMGTARGIPGNTKAIEILTEAGMVTEFDQSILNIMNDTEGLYQGPYFGQASVYSIYTDILEQYGLGTVDSKEAAESLVNQAEAAVAEIKSNQ
ncbi:ABC transporter substrate-binding protein [Enterococcus sp. JM9B]|uniref:ABC transporter substrate-binding protein n=1 Tax=Enterococcus sp. JM9B TaxID=1857216 RepID=UPI001374BF94|nr:ABC transporter substrate-binding protein [Enterococcus sp. JM9B]KAF1303152.1 hypothetical protein BAU16_05110 [Enterococcus sp. JM9B]